MYLLDMVLSGNYEKGTRKSSKRDGLVLQVPARGRELTEKPGSLAR